MFRHLLRGEARYLLEYISSSRSFILLFYLKQMNQGGGPVSSGPVLPRGPLSVPLVYYFKLVFDIPTAESKGRCFKFPGEFL